MEDMVRSTMIKSEKRIIFLLKYSPLLFVLILASLITFSSYMKYQENLLDKKNNLKSEYLLNEKNRIKNEVNKTYSYIQKVYNSAEENLKFNLKDKVDLAFYIINSIYTKNKNTKSKAVIVENIKNALQSIRFFEGRGYYFIYDTKANNVFHPIKPHREGKNFYHVQDAKGLYLNQVAIDIVQTKGEGFFEFYFHKPNDLKKEHKKFGFVKLFEPYSWFVGTGEYLNDFESIVKNQMLLSHKLENHEIYIMNKEKKIIVDTINTVDESSLLNNIKSLPFKEDGFYDKLENKIMYGKKFEKWDWFIFSSFDISALDNIINKQIEKITQEYNETIKKLFLSSILITIPLLLFTFYISRIIEKSFLEYKQRISETLTQNINQKNLIKKQIELLSKYVIYSKANLDGIITEVSDAYCKISGYSKNELVGKPFNILTSNDFKDLSYKGIWDNITIGKSWSGEIKNIKKDGTVFWVDATIFPEFNQQGKIVEYIGIRHDITDKKKYEEQYIKLLESQKLASMGEMIENIAHQWRQPLSVISSTSTGIKLQKELDMLTDEFLLESCDMINENSKYLSNTIDDFRNFVNKNSQKKLFHVNKAIENFLSLVKSTQQVNAINIILDIENDIQTNGYKNELIQCLINIFNNAKDAFIENEIDERYLFITSQIKDKKVFLHIKDNAKGIPPDILPKIFEPYFSTKFKAQGTGIGLHMTYKLIEEQMNGTISACNVKYEYEGVEYRGAEFIISLPLD